MDRNIDYISYLPPVIKAIKEFQILAEIKNPEIRRLWVAAEEIYLDQFVEHATVNGVKRWERMLQIQPKGGDNLEVRKFRIVSRLNEMLPYTYRALENVLDALCGVGRYKMTLCPGECRLDLLLELTVKKLFDEVEATAKRMIPANIILETKLRYNQWKDVNVTWGVLEARTWNETREEAFL